MSEALALIAHDLKNALGALEAELSHLIDEPTPLLAQRAHIHCSDLRRQLVQFLTLYGADHGGISAMCEDEDPQAFLQSVIQVWKAKLQADERHVHIEFVPNELAPSFWYFDRRLVQLALDAAIHNAVRFAKHTVRTRVEQVDAMLTWTICDDGDGIGATDPGRQHSTGLGTALALAVAQAHRLNGQAGQISLSSEEGSGACFTLSLP
jgi:signal transduction histidine kinase